MSFKDELKKQLDEIINYAMKQENYYSEKFHWYKLEIDWKLIKNKVIEYKQQDKTIYIYAKTNTMVNRYTHNEMFVLLLHEVACFIKDHSIYKSCTTHGPEFWMLYNSLLIAAVRHGYVQAQKIEEIGPVIEGYNKVKDIAHTIRQEETKSTDRVRYTLYNVEYEKGSDCKNQGYKWNPLGRVWYKEMTKKEVKNMPENKNAYAFQINRIHLLANK